MTCEKIQAFLPDMIVDSAHVPADVRQHLASCPLCGKQWDELRATMQLLDEWRTPEPSPYFDVRMAARLREEKNSAPLTWLERIRARLLFNSDLRLRPAMAAALALLLMVGAGSYEGFVHLDRTRSASGQSVSATVRDLELLDSNAQTLQQMAAFDDSDAGVGQGAGNGSSE